MQRQWLLRAQVVVLCMLAAAMVHAADEAPAKGAQGAAPPADARPLFDADGWLDMSKFLDTAYGFIPIVVPITEPAVGYGAAGALVFIDREAPGQWGERSRPNIAVVGGLGTENGTRGAFAGHLGTWMNGRLRTIAALADADVNLEFFGFGGERTQGESGLGYSIAARGGLVGASYRLGESPWWIGARFGQARTKVALDAPGAGLPNVSSADFDLRLAALVPQITLDMRDNFFTPTHGWYVDLSAPLFREALGSDRDFEKATLTAMHFRPLAQSLYLGVRGTAKASSDGTPFFLRPYVALRGVQALRYQGERAAELEAELRWQLHPRFSLTAFGGAGVARGESTLADREQNVTTAGAGFRYLIARTYGLHVGMDVAVGPDDPVLYIVFGSAWARP
jgi:hypothetical protein